MRFLKTFFRFFTIVTLCNTFTSTVWGYAVNKNSEKQDGITCSSLSIASCNSYAGCAVYYENSTTSCQESVCNVVAGCKNRAGCAYYSAACRVVDAGYYSETGTNDYYECPEGYYCREGTGHKYSDPCPAGTYNPYKGKKSSSDCTSCPAGYPSSAAGSDASSDCYFNIPAGYEYDVSTNSNITCHAGGYCPGVKIFYNAEKKDEWGWDSCNGGKFKNENTGLTPTSNPGSNVPTNCYVICPDETIANGSVVPYNHTTYPSNMYATQTGTSQFTYSKCKYKLTCNSGYTKSNEIDTLSNLKCNIVTYTITYKVGGDSGDITLTNLTPASYTVETATFNLPTTTLTGHTFAGWYTTKAFSGTAVSQITKGSTGHKTFYVKFTPNTYKLSYNLNDGTSGGTQPATATYNSEFTVSNPTRTGYTFAGWDITGMDSVTHTYGSSTTTNTSISATKATTFKNLHSTKDATVTFTATWSANACNITYSCGTGSGTAPTVSEAPKYDSSYTTAGLGGCKKPGYYFTGWKVGNTDTILAPSTTTTKWQYETTTLTAQWAGCNAGNFCTGEKTAEEACPSTFTSDNLATTKELCYLNPELKLKDTINTTGVFLKEIYTGKIYFKGNSS